MGEPKRAARRAENSTVVEWLARLGLVARGVIWLVIGLLATEVALGGNAEADRAGALRSIAGKPFGSLLLGVLVVGFVGYGAWRLLEAAVGHTADQGRKRWLKRGLSLSRGVLYLGLAVSTVRFLSSGAGSSDRTSPLTAQVMRHTAGRELVFLVGAAVVFGGLAMAVRAARGTFLDKLQQGPMSGRVRTAARALGTAGLAVRGLGIALIGGFLVDAAVRFDPAKAKGLDAALKTLAQQALGKLLLFMATLGLFAFAAWSFLEARYRKI